MSEKRFNDLLYSAYEDVNSAILRAEHAKETLAELYKGSEKKTKGQLIDEAKATGKYKAIDSALPQGWLDDVNFKTGFYVPGIFAWAYYPDYEGEGPLPLTEQAETILEIYEYICKNELRRGL